MLQKPIEILFGLAMFINALLFIPQIIKLIKVNHANEMSLLTFVGFLLIQAVTCAHGIIHQDPVLIVGTAMSMITCSTVVILIIFYKLKIRWLRDEVIPDKCSRS